MGESAACQQLRTELVAFGFVSLGICGDVRHCGGGQSPCSGGGSSDHCHGNAFDAGNDGIDRDTRYAVIDHILHDGRCTYCIHEGRGQRSYHRGGTYFDSSGHSDHFHTSVHSDSRRDDGSSWGIAQLGEPEPEPAKPEPLITPKDEAMDSIEYLGQRHWFGTSDTGRVAHYSWPLEAGAVVESRWMPGQVGAAASQPDVCILPDGTLQVWAMAGHDADGGLTAPGSVHHWYSTDGKRFVYQWD